MKSAHLIVALHQLTQFAGYDPVNSLGDLDFGMLAVADIALEDAPPIFPPHGFAGFTCVRDKGRPGRLFAAALTGLEMVSGSHCARSFLNLRARTGTGLAAEARSDSGPYAGRVKAATVQNAKVTCPTPRSARLLLVLEAHARGAGAGIAGL
jgi:hypothetical protein